MNVLGSGWFACIFCIFFLILKRPYKFYPDKTTFKTGNNTLLIEVIGVLKWSVYRGSLCIEVISV